VFPTSDVMRHSAYRGIFPTIAHVKSAVFAHVLGLAVFRSRTEASRCPIQMRWGLTLQLAHPVGKVSCQVQNTKTEEIPGLRA
jgi:hypothetical protein